MFNGISNTKTSQEDILQEVTNPTRANRRKDMSMTRAFFTMATSERLDSLPTRVLKLQKGDLALLGKQHNVIVDNFNPRPAKALKKESLVFKIAATALKTGNDQAGT